MIIIDDKWMYIHIPKTSGTNFRQNIIETYSENKYSNYNNRSPFGNITEHQIQNLTQISKNFFYNEYNFFLSNLNKNDINELLFDMNKLNRLKVILSINHSNNIKHFKLNFWEKNLIYRDHLVFSIVRNPYTRLVSFFNIIYRNMKNNFNIEFTLKEFVNSNLIDLFANSFNFMNFKQPQVDYLKNSSGKIICNKFYKMETDIEQLSIDFNLPNLNKEKINYGNYDRNYSELFDTELIDWVQEKYKEDFEFFDYNLTPFWM